jgi:hypothetical protein
MLLKYLVYSVERMMCRTECLDSQQNTGCVNRLVGVPSTIQQENVYNMRWHPADYEYRGGIHESFFSA